MRIKTSIELGLVIRNHRRRLRWSQSELARRADVGRQWLIAVEQGKPGAEIGLILRTLTAMGLALSVAEAQTGRDAAATRLPAIDLDAVVAAARTGRP